MYTQANILTEYTPWVCCSTRRTVFCPVSDHSSKQHLLSSLVLNIIIVPLVTSVLHQMCRHVWSCDTGTMILRIFLNLIDRATDMKTSGDSYSHDKRHQFAEIFFSEYYQSR